MTDNNQAVITTKLLDTLADLAKLKALDITPWWNFSKGGKHLSIESYDLGGFAHVCCVYSWTVFGVARGETIICTPYAKDLPIFIVDYSRKIKDEVLNLEFYDDQIAPVNLYDVGMAAPQFNELPAAQLPSGFHDQNRMPPSYGVSGRDCLSKMEKIADFTMRAYAQVVQKCEPCEEQAKRKLIESYVESLLSSQSAYLDFYRKVLSEKDVPTFVKKVIFGLR